jgi:nucleotide-binding universal stress UspA family protein
MEMSINSEGQPWPRALTHEELDWPTSDQRVLVPFHEAVNLSETGTLGGSVAFGASGELYLLHTVDPENVDGAAAARERAGLELEIREEFGVPVTTSVREYSRDVLDSFVDSRSITTTVVDEDEHVYGGDASTAVKGCHTAVGTGMARFESPSSILVPVASGPHSGLATKIAQSIASAYDCWLELFHVIPEGASEDARDDARALLDAYEYRLEEDVEVDRHLYEEDDPAAAIIEHAEYHSLTVLGAPQKGKLRRFIFGSTTDRVRENVDHGPVLTAQREDVDSTFAQWL